MNPRAPGGKRPKRRGLQGTVYARGKTWVYLIELGPDPLTGKRRRDYGSGFRSERDAWDALAEANSKLRSGTHVKRSSRTVAEFLEEWLTAVKISLKPTTYSNYRSYAEHYIIPIIGSRDLQDIEPETISRLYAHLLQSGRRRRDSNQIMHDEWKRQTARGLEPRPRALAEAAGVSYSAAVRAAQRYRAGRVPATYNPGLEPRSVQTIHIMLNRALSDAKTWKYIETNPAATAPRIRRERRGHSVWTPQQLRAFLETASQDRLAAMWLMLATTGVRRSEIAGAQTELLDLDAMTITLWKTRVVAGGQAVESDGKSQRSRRTLALDRRTVDLLAQRVATLKAEKAAFDTDYNDNGLLFCWPDGRPLYPDTITEQFKRLVDRAALPPITLHSVRHTYATIALRAGVNPKIVSSRLGHATVAFTLDTYTEDVPELHHDAAESVSSLFLDPLED